MESSDNGTGNGHDDYERILARMGIGKPADILEIILCDAGPDWFTPDAIAILAQFRHDPLVWGRVHATAKMRDIFPPDLDAAVDAYLKNNQYTPEGKDVHVVTVSKVAVEEVHWLWKPYIPLRKLTLLEGDPGLGKSWLALQMSACVSRGWAFPDANGFPQAPHGPAQEVLYMSAEDGIGDTLRPRLEAAGADCTKIHALLGWKQEHEGGEEEHGPITLGDIDLIETAIATYCPRLVVIDPLQGYLGAGVDMHRANETRPILANLTRLAERYHCAILCIRHISKAPQARAIYRGIGSIDFAAAARSMLLVGEDPQYARGENKRVMAHVKSSLSSVGPSLSFELRDDNFFWTGVVAITADELLAPLKSSASREYGEDEQSALEQAQDFLKELLRDGPVSGRDVERCARIEGIGLRTLNRAKKNLGVKSHKRTSQGVEKRMHWEWSLPVDESP